MANGRFVNLAGLGNLPPNVPGQPPTRFAFNGPAGFIAPPTLFAASLGLALGVEVGVIGPSIDEQPPASP